MLELETVLILALGSSFIYISTNRKRLPQNSKNNTKAIADRGGINLKAFRNSTRLYGGQHRNWTDIEGVKVRPDSSGRFIYDTNTAMGPSLIASAMINHVGKSSEHVLGIREKIITQGGYYNVGHTDKPALILNDNSIN